MKQTPTQALETLANLVDQVSLTGPQRRIVDESIATLAALIKQTSTPSS